MLPLDWRICGDGGSRVGGPRRLERHQPSLLSYGLDDAVHQSAKPDELTADHAHIYEPCHANASRHERPAEN
jgi:hypothetical protein